MTTLEEIFEELNKPKNKIIIVSKLIKEQEHKEKQENDEQPELSK